VPDRLVKAGFLAKLCFEFHDFPFRFNQRRQAGICIINRLPW